MSAIKSIFCLIHKIYNLILFEDIYFFELFYLAFLNPMRNEKA